MTQGVWVQVPSVNPYKEKMKTDKDKVKELLTNLDVGFNEFDKLIELEVGNKKVKGYVGFYTWFEFDTDGKFVKMGIGE